MKIFFLPIETEWAVKAGYQRQWQRYIQGLPQSGKGYAIVDDPSLADFVIRSNDTPINARTFRETLKPLDRLDVETFTWNIFDHPDGRLSGFYCSLPRNQFDRRRHTTISYPGPFNERIDAFPLGDASLDFSFIGQNSSRVRNHLLHMLGALNGGDAIVRDSGRTVWAAIDGKGTQQEIDSAKQEYADAIRRSKFILCPRGFGTGSIRLFEAMQAGRVPVILSDDYVKPEGLDWGSFSLTVPERMVADIPGIVARRMSEWESMAKKAREVWLANFSPKHIMDYFATNLLRMSQEVEGGGYSPLFHSVRAGGAYLQFKARSLLSGLNCGLTA